jgi:hypothetical protein
VPGAPLWFHRNVTSSSAPASLRTSVGSSAATIAARIGLAWRKPRAPASVSDYGDEASSIVVFASMFLLMVTRICPERRRRADAPPPLGGAGGRGDGPVTARQRYCGHANASSS